MKYVLAALAGLALVVALWGFAFGFRWVTAAPKGKLAAREQIQSGSYRIAAYDHFYDLCASIQGLEGQLDAQRSQLDGASSDEADRIRANIAGISGARAQAVAEYNADARKSYTLGQFKASNLPYTISLEGTTSCGN